MKIVIFCHSILSDWNHGNAHFLRGVASEMTARGWQVRVYEPANAWSLKNLIADSGEEPLERFRAAYPELTSERYDPAALDLQEALDGADLVLVHEWNEPDLVRRIGLHHLHHSGYTLLFHDTHHRSVTDPASLSRYDLTAYDGVLAFGESVAEVYRRRGWGRRVWIWHEAADTRRFHPLPANNKGDLVWIGNWGDDERTSELHEFLLAPIRTLGLRALVHGVRYPSEAIAVLADTNVTYGGWVPNFEVPAIFAQYSVTVHVPRRPYARALPGVPTIRMFEALACGMPLVSAPWQDTESLFTSGKDFLVAEDGAAMTLLLGELVNDAARAAELGRQGRATVLKRHTCGHRVDELAQIHHGIQQELITAVIGDQVQ
jgi:spore maturation protein CgeB